jgi:Domain of unknown function (DUF397)
MPCGHLSGGIWGLDRHPRMGIRGAVPHGERWRSLMTAGSSTDPAQDAVVLNWQRSTFCTATGCVEVALAREAVYVRDSGSESGQMIVVSFSAWRDLLRGVRAGLLDP